MEDTEDPSRSVRDGAGDTLVAAGDWGIGVLATEGWEWCWAIAASCRLCCCVAWTVPSSDMSNTTIEQYPSALESIRVCPSGDLFVSPSLFIILSQPLLAPPGKIDPRKNPRKKDIPSNIGKPSIM
jgi:hypothetical protein